MKILAMEIEVEGVNPKQFQPYVSQGRIRARLGFVSKWHDP